MHLPALPCFRLEFPAMSRSMSRLALACIVMMVVGAVACVGAAWSQEPGSSVAELRNLCRNMAKDHISAGARQRASQFLLGTNDRVWRDSTGAHQTIAAYHRHDVLPDGKVMVTLRKSDGDLVQIDRDRLSLADQTLVSELARILTRLGEDAETYRDYLREKLERRTVERYSTGGALPYTGSGYTISSGYPGAGVSVGWGYPTYSAYPYYGAVYSPTWPYAYPYGYSTYGRPIYGYGYGFGYGGRPGHYHGTRPNRPSRPRPPAGGGGAASPRKGPRSPYTGGDVYGF